MLLKLFWLNWTWLILETHNFVDGNFWICLSYIYLTSSGEWGFKLKFSSVGELDNVIKL